MKTLSDIDVRGKRVLMRVDYNVPMQNGKVVDATRIDASLPTIEFLLDEGAAVILMSHLGRPKAGPEDRYRLAPVAAVLEALLGRPVRYVASLPGSEETARALEDLQPGEVALLENVRFEAGEEKNDPNLARQLAALGDAFVLDAFGSAHRAHASVSGVAALLPHAAGLLMEKEVRALGRLLSDPARPYVVVIGGAKVSDKLGVIEHLLPRVDKLLIGGGMAYTFVKARGGQIGDSIHEDDRLALARRLLEEYADKIELPSDVVAADRFAGDAETRVVPVGEIPDGWQGLDIGPETRRKYAGALQGARTVFWNGPMGVFEFDKFAAGTEAIARAIANLAGAYSVIGGGDSVSAINKSGLAGQVSHISTGGGASLELLEGRELPGVAAMG